MTTIDPAVSLCLRIRRRPSTGLPVPLAEVDELLQATIAELELAAADLSLSPLGAELDSRMLEGRPVSRESQHPASVLDALRACGTSDAIESAHQALDVAHYFTHEFGGTATHWLGDLARVVGERRAGLEAYLAVSKAGRASEAARLLPVTSELFSAMAALLTAVAILRASETVVGGMIAMGVSQEGAAALIEAQCLLPLPGATTLSSLLEWRSQT